MSSLAIMELQKPTNSPDILTPPRNVLALPEEILSMILSRLSKKSLYTCVQVCRDFHRLAVRLGLETMGIYVPEQHCNIKLPDEFYVHRRPDTLDFLLALTPPIKVFKCIEVDLCIGTTHSGLATQLYRIRRLLEKATTVKSAILAFAFPYLVGEDDDADPGALEGALEALFNLLVSKGCTDFRIDDWSDKIVAGYQDPAIEGKAFSSGWILQDERQYIRSIRLPKYCWRSLKYNPSAPPKITHFQVSMELLRPPFSEWSFSLLANSPVTSLVMPIRSYPWDTDEVQFIMHRCATMGPLIDSMFVGFERCQFYQVLPGLNFFSKTLTKLRLHGVPPRHSQWPDSLTLHLPNLESIELQPLGLRGLLSGPVDKVRLPRLKQITLVHNDNENDGAIPPFDIETVAQSVLDVQRLDKFQRPKQGCGENKDGEDHDDHSSISLGARLVFCIANADFRALTASLMKGIPPTLASKERSDALKRVTTLTIEIRRTKHLIQSGAFKHQLIGSLALFPGTETLNVVSLHGSLAVKEDLDEYQFNTLKHHCSSLREAFVY
ncbi:hypothetical protein CC1G_07606 [Coprinopsis cinerea okayama7|uniref:F-box domain-containing protein n=1 Tax=Coprinopsis cinerea (strain Okayama-7 / 130 / ATCC MYA-4618 / FGSC 9003) TaxID=240176 RepID=A8NUS4_COPC7|nr:hypothetical protein CC1G_07606 [Coprinopsis cinerea okayama7\|eukprot:XP_001836523.1 hypothetical protein CC1G_07606 [Coprinopsis cinerea okayama7\